jgi:hypothetical protein
MPAGETTNIKAITPPTKDNGLIEKNPRGFDRKWQSQARTPSESIHLAGNSN